MRLAFLGTPEAAVPSLRALVDAGHDVVLVITRPDRKRGRGGRLSPSPVKECANELGLTVSRRLNDLDDVDVERGVVVAFGRLISSDALERVPMLNVHYSLLPRWRGAAPVARALLEVLATPELLANARAQQGDVTYATKLSKEDFHLAPSSSATHLLRIIRLGQAFTMVNGRRLLVQSAALYEGGAVAAGSVTRREGHVVLGAHDGAIALEQVRPESGKSMSANAWWDGARLDGTVVQWA